MDVLPRFQKLADERFVIGTVYPMAEVEARSEASHKQEFAWLREAWASLPEDIAGEYATSEHLRKRALIATGWCNVSDYVCSSAAEAVRWAANLRKETDDYTMITVSASVVRVFKAKSQSKQAMGAADFYRSKGDILEWIAKLLDVTPSTLSRQMESA